MKHILSVISVGVLTSCLAGAAPGGHGFSGGTMGSMARPMTMPSGTAHTMPSSTASTTTTGTSSTATAARTTATPRATGQPNQSCGSATAPNTPGNAASAPGSAFNPNGVAGTQYAGQQPQNSVNPAAVSQYDVACFHQP